MLEQLLQVGDQVIPAGSHSSLADEIFDTMGKLFSQQGGQYCTLFKAACLRMEGMHWIKVRGICRDFTIKD